MEAFIVILILALVIVGAYAFDQRQKALVNLRPRKMRCVVLPVGLGGTGKTTLARHLSGNPSADPTKKTEGFHIYKSELTTKANDAEARNYIRENYIIDYMGQRPALLVSEFSKLTRDDPLGQVRIGSVNCLIFVIDLVAPPDAPGDVVEPRDFADQQRLQDQMNEWGAVAIDLLFGLFSKDNLKYVCIFLNKADLLLRPDAKDEAVHAIQPLREKLRLKQDANGFQMEVIVGSMDRGDGLNRLREMIERHSVWVS